MVGCFYPTTLFLFQVKILLEDYRNVNRTFDKIVSIEMLEAVGHEYLGVFFECCDRLLKPDGLMVIQSITTPDDRYDNYRKEPDWIRKHIFPGGHLPSLKAICKDMSENTSFIIEHLENIGIHYSLTLKELRQRFASKKERMVLRRITPLIIFIKVIQLGCFSLGALTKRVGHKLGQFPPTQIPSGLPV